MEKLSDLFQVSYWTKFDFNKMEVSEDGFLWWVNFVSRTSQNNGIIAKVKIFKDKEPLKAWQITVSLWWSYVLSAFLQIENFYTAQNVAVLTPKFDLSERELFYYCLCITKNRFRYWAFWREANVTLKDLLVPSREEIPDFVYNTKIPDYLDIKESLNNKKIDLISRNWKYFDYQELFDLEKWKRLTKSNMEKWNNLYIWAISINNWISSYISKKPIFKENTITISYDWSIWEAFYQDKCFWASDAVNVLNPKFELNKYIWMFLISIFRKEKYRYNYWRKWGLDKMKISRIKLPVDDSWNPDRQFMEDYIKSLPYSKYL
jgi:hypothetical protein